jgi:hypothetical protein
MKKAVSVLTGMALVFMAASCSSGIQYSRTDDGIGAKRVTSAEATVVEIDHERRTAILKDADGRMQSITLNPEANNIEQVKVGDKVIAEVVESIEISVRKSGEDPSSDVFETVQRDPDSPGAQKVAVSESTARIEKINYDTRMITLSGKNGRQVTIEAGPEIKKINELKPGDIIVMQTVKQTIIRVESQ